MIGPPPHLVSVLVLIHPLTGKTVLVIVVAGTLVVTIAKRMEIGVILKPPQTKHAVHVVEETVEEPTRKRLISEIVSHTTTKEILLLHLGEGARLGY